MGILCELRNWGSKEKLNYFNSIELENVIINIIINNNVKGLKRKRKENIYYIYFVLATRVTKIHSLYFWSFGRPILMVRAPGRWQTGKNDKGASRFIWGGGNFEPPHASFIDQNEGFIV